MTSSNPAYDRLVQKMKDQHPEKISDKEAHRLARNLMGYCELVIRINARRERERLDAAREAGMLFMRWLFG